MKFDSFDREATHRLVAGRGVGTRANDEDGNTEAELLDHAIRESSRKCEARAYRRARGSRFAPR